MTCGASSLIRRLGATRSQGRKTHVLHRQHGRGAVAGIGYVRVTFNSMNVVSLARLSRGRRESPLGQSVLHTPGFSRRGDWVLRA